jgi:predicted signal transduction protein with EAL and GGDEF domain
MLKDYVVATGDAHLSYVNVRAETELEALQKAREGKGTPMYQPVIDTLDRYYVVDEADGQRWAESEPGIVPESLHKFAEERSKRIKQEVLVVRVMVRYGKRPDITQ